MAIDELIQLLKASGRLLAVNNIAYVIVYADDTTLVCDNIETMNELIKTDRILLHKRRLTLKRKVNTQWMKLNEPVYEINGKPMIRPPLLG